MEMKVFFATLLSLLINNSFSKVNIEKSELKWTGKKIAGTHTGTVPIKKASLIIDNEMIKEAEIVVDLTRLEDLDLSGEWKIKLENHLKSADFFNVEKFPEASLKITSSTSNKLYGTLTIKGKTNKIVVPYTRRNNIFIGKLIFDRTDYDMVYRSGNFFKDLGDKVIENEVVIDFKIVND